MITIQNLKSSLIVMGFSEQDSIFDKEFTKFGVK